MKKSKFTVVLAMVAGLSGCASSFDISEEVKNGELRPGEKKAMQAARGTTYVREIRSEDLAKRKPIYLSAKDKSLRSVLQETLPGYSIIPRGQVNLNAPVDVSARGMTVEDFTEYLEGTLDIDIQIEGNRVYVSDFETREWNLAAFAATRSVKTTVTSGQSSGAKAGDSMADSSANATDTTRSTIGLNLSEDEWMKILVGARSILGLPNTMTSMSAGGAMGSNMPGAMTASNMQQQTGKPFGSATDGLNFGDLGMNSGVPSLNNITGMSGNSITGMSGNSSQRAYIEGVRSVGIITAGGSPSKMRVLDRYLKRAIAESTKIINVKVEAYDVVLNNNKQKGVNWDALINGAVNGNPLGITLSQNPSAITSGNDPFWNVAGTYQSDKASASFLIKFLESFGRVELQDQPNLTVRNGVPAQIYAGEELTYIVDVEQRQDMNGNVTVTPKLGRLKVGVTLSLTARVLDDDKLLVDIMPVISNLNSPDTIMIGNYQFNTPRIALKEFSTQIITTSGQPVHLGGLITKRMKQAMEHLPWQNLVTKAVLNPVTENINNSVERRELVLVVTPTLVEGAN